MIFLSLIVARWEKLLVIFPRRDGYDIYISKFISSLSVLLGDRLDIYATGDYKTTVYYDREIAVLQLTDVSKILHV